MLRTAEATGLAFLFGSGKDLGCDVTDFGTLAVNALPELLLNLRDEFASRVMAADPDDGPGSVEAAMSRLCTRVLHMRTNKGIAADHIMQILQAVKSELGDFLPAEFEQEWPRHWYQVKNRYANDIAYYSFVFNHDPFHQGKKSRRRAREADDGAGTVPQACVARQDRDQKQTRALYRTRHLAQAWVGRRYATPPPPPHAAHLPHASSVRQASRVFAGGQGDPAGGRVSRVRLEVRRRQHQEGSGLGP